MRRQLAQVLVAILLGVVLSALTLARSEASTTPTDDGSDPTVPESTVAPSTTDPEDSETAPPDGGPAEEDDGESALVIALGIAGCALLLVLAGRWMIRRSDLDDLAPDDGAPDWPGSDMP